MSEQGDVLAGRSRTGRRMPLLGVMAVAVVALVGASVLIPRLLPGPAPAGAGSSATAATVVSPSVVTAPGCGPSAVVAMPADNDPTLRAYGPAAKFPLEGLTVAATDARAQALVHPLVPPAPPTGLALQTTMLAPWTAAGATADTKLLLIYGPSATNGLAVSDIIGGRGWILAEAPPAGKDAASVRRTLDSLGPGAARAYAMVQVGPYEAILVLATAPTPIGRPYGLYWSDGTRDLSLQAAAASNQVVDFARSLYCR